MKYRQINLIGAPRTIQVTMPPSHECSRSPDGLSLNGYDHAVTRWLNHGRIGLRPQRQVRRAA